MSKTVAALSAGVMSVSLVGAGLVAEGMTGAADAAGTCPNNHHAGNLGLTGKGFSGDGVHIRTGDAITCTGLGLGYKSDSTVQMCGTWNGSHHWDYMLDVTTGVLGWVREDNLNYIIYNGC